MTQALDAPEGRGRRFSTGRVLGGISWGGVAVIACWGALRGDWQLASVSAACMGLALLPKAYTAASDMVFPTGVCTGILIFNAAALLAGELGGLYTTSFWWDVGLHTTAGAVLAVMGMALGMTATGGARPAKVPLRVLAILAVGFAMMVGAMWELFEFSIDALFGTHAQRSGLPDTMGDELSNLIGAVVGAVAGHARIARGARWPLAGLLGRFMAANPALYPDLEEHPGGPLP